MTRFPRLFLFALAVLAMGLACLPADAAQPGGPPGGGFFAGRGGMGGFGGGLNLGMVASNAQAQEKLALTDAEKEAVAAAVKASRGPRGGMPEGFRDMSEEEQGKVMKEMAAARQKAQEALAKALKEALGPEKFAKLGLLAAGVALQLGPGALANAEVAEAVGVSKKSQTKVAELVEASFKDMRGLFAGMRDDPEGTRGKITEARTALNKQISAVLTAEEKEKVKAVVDAAADIKIESGRRGGGGRGARGGGQAPPPPPQ